MSLFVIWLQFPLCVALIGAAGTALSHHGGVIADTRFSCNGIGLVYLHGSC